MCHLLLKYDLELTPGCDISVQVNGFTLSPNRAAKIKVRRRKAELDLDSL